jgi:hypothetical protein
VYNESSSTPKQVNLFTLGQPRVGNQDFSDFAWEQLPTATRVVHQNDVGKIFLFFLYHSANSNALVLDVDRRRGWCTRTI